jgi:predicted  nucleic acid-binding Zn-ribbon protein
MKNNCKLCGGKYDFRMVQIDEYLNMTGIAFTGSKRQVNNDNRFRFCPKCGRELTKEDFGGVDFVNELDMREKIKEYIGELEMEIKRLEDHLEEHMNDEACRVTEIETRMETLQEVINDLKGRSEERI